MKHLNKYSSIVPSEMNNRELQHICTELQTSIISGAEYTKVLLTSNNMEYRVPISRLKDYQDAHQTMV